MVQPFQQWFVELMDILGNCAVIIAMFAAIIGLIKWRIELLGRKRFELSRKIILLAYEFRDQFLLFREKTEWFEGNLLIRIGVRAPYEEEVLKTENSDIYRFLQPLIITQNKLRTLVWEADIILLPEDIKPIENFEGALNKVRKAVVHYYSELITQARISQTGKTDLFPDKYMEEWCQIVFGTNNKENDLVLIKIEQGLEDLKKSLKKYLQ